MVTVREAVVQGSRPDAGAGAKSVPRRCDEREADGASGRIHTVSPLQEALAISYPASLAAPSVTPSLSNSLETARIAARTAAENRGRDVRILDLRKLTPICDYFVVATGASRRQLHAMSEEIDRVLNSLGHMRLGLEGYQASRWILLDYGDVVIHLFDEDSRAYYDLEQLWCEAPRMEWEASPTLHVKG
jgi:ribosome-associated protein